MDVIEYVSAKGTRYRVREMLNGRFVIQFKRRRDYHWKVHVDISTLPSYATQETAERALDRKVKTDGLKKVEKEK